MRVNLLQIIDQTSMSVNIDDHRNFGNQLPYIDKLSILYFNPVNWIYEYNGDAIMNYEIDAMKPSDWEQVASIYLEGIHTGKATFQTEVPDWESWDSGHIKVCRLVIRSGGDILGWAALSPFSKRPVYSGVADTSIYIGQKHRGLGLGKILLNELILESEKNGFWTLRARLISENAASLALHKSCGFREVGIEEKIGKMENGVWHDVIITERRSKVVGIN